MVDTATVPDAAGRFGEYGGRYVPETLVHPLRELEEEGGMHVQILGTEGLFPEHVEFDCRDSDGREIAFN